MVYCPCSLVSNQVDQPRFQPNIPSNRWYIARIFQIWSAPVGYEELAGGFNLSQSRTAKYFERIMEKNMTSMETPLFKNSKT